MGDWEEMEAEERGGGKNGRERDGDSIKRRGGESVNGGKAS